MNSVVIFIFLFTCDVSSVSQGLWPAPRKNLCLPRQGGKRKRGGEALGHIGAGAGGGQARWDLPVRVLNWQNLTRAVHMGMDGGTNGQWPCLILKNFFFLILLTLVLFAFWTIGRYSFYIQLNINVWPQTIYNEVTFEMESFESTRERIY